MSVTNNKSTKAEPVGLYGKIIRTAEVERGGIKGLLVWDAILFNEITFEEKITHKMTSLYRCWDDKKAESVFDNLVKEYTSNDKAADIDNTVNGDIINERRKELEVRAKEFLEGDKKVKANKEEYNELINSFEKFIENVSNADPIYDVYNQLMDLK